MMLATEVRDWLGNLPSGARVAVDDGGLCLVYVDPAGVADGDYLEVGGKPILPAECDDCTDGERFTNHYECGDCNVAWDDEWSCACDDECPECGKAYTPVRSIAFACPTCTA